MNFKAPTVPVVHSYETEDEGETKSMLITELQIHNLPLCWLLSTSVFPWREKPNVLSELKVFTTFTMSSA